ncbi:hypothetical protein EON81_05575 [bacterium]|nr:MAG: hypothetical protein EON81_05575 [bacterium]
MKLRSGLFFLPILLTACGGATGSDNGQLLGIYRFTSISVAGSKTFCPGSVTVDDIQYACGADTLRFDGSSVFTAFRNGDTTIGNYSFSSGSLSMVASGNSRTASVDFQDAGEVIVIRFNFSNDEVWTLQKND